MIRFLMVDVRQLIIDSLPPGMDIQTWYVALATVLADHSRETIDGARAFIQRIFEREDARR